MFEDLYDLREFCCQESETEDEIESKKWLSYETTLGHIINHTQTMDGLHPQYNGHIFPIWLHPDFRMDSEFGEYLRENMCLVNTLLGDKAFREGTDRYFDRFDGQAVTTEDFAQAVTEGQDFDLPRFQRWYDQPGTPVLTVNRHYDADAQTLTLRFEQHYPELPNWKKDRQPVIIPVKLGLISVEGDVLPLETEHAEFKASSQTEGVFVFKEAADEIVFNNVPEETIPSLLRGFSAPVILRAQYSQQELATLVAHDADLFNRWDAAQNIMSQIILQGASSSMFLEVFGQTCFNNDIDPGARALICQLPSYTALEQLQVQDTGSIQVEQILDGQKPIRHSLKS